MPFFDYLEKKHSILVIGPPRSEKGILAEQFAIEGMKKGEKALYVLTNNFPEDFLSEISGIGNFHMESSLIRIIDCYTNFVGVPRGDTDMSYAVSGPNALNEISIAMSKAMKEAPKRIVFDSGSTILLHNSINNVERFFQVLIGRLHNTAVLMILLEEGVHDAKDVAVMESLTSLTIRFKEEPAGKYMELSSISENKKIQYEVAGKRIMIKQPVEVY